MKNEVFNSLSNTMMYPQSLSHHETIRNEGSSSVRILDNMIPIAIRAGVRFKLPAYIESPI